MRDWWRSVPVEERLLILGLGVAGGLILYCAVQLQGLAAGF